MKDKPENPQAVYWTSVEDELPVTDTRIVIGYIKSGPSIAYSQMTLTMNSNFWMYVTHWMPLPNPPQEMIDAMLAERSKSDE